MKSKSIMLLIAILLFGLHAYAERVYNDGLTITIDDIILRDSWNDIQEESVKWLEVKVTATNWDIETLDISEHLSAQIVFKDKYVYSAELDFPKYSIESLFDINGSLIFRLPNRVINSVSDGTMLIIEDDNRRLNRLIDFDTLRRSDDDFDVDALFDAGRFIESDFPKTHTPDITVEGLGYIDNGKQYFTGDSFTVKWDEDSDAKGYIVSFLNPDGETATIEKTTDNYCIISTDNLKPGLYIVCVGVILTDELNPDIVWGSATFGVEVPMTPDPILPSISAVVPYGESFEFATQIRADGTARIKPIKNEKYETVKFKVALKDYMEPADFAIKWGEVYHLNGTEAGAGIEMTLLDYSGTAAIIPQNIIKIVFRSESGNLENPGFQLMDSEIAGNTDVSVTSNTPKILWKRYTYTNSSDPIKYIAISTYNDGLIQTILFELPNK